MDRLTLTFGHSAAGSYSGGTFVLWTKAVQVAGLSASLREIRRQGGVSRTHQRAVATERVDRSGVSGWTKIPNASKILANIGFAVVLVAVGVVHILRGVAIIGGPCETLSAQLPAGVGPYAPPVFETPGSVNGTVLKALAISPERMRRDQPPGILDNYGNDEEFLRAEHSTW